jgi:hypothetical protein
MNARGRQLGQKPHLSTPPRHGPQGSIVDIQKCDGATSCPADWSELEQVLSLRPLPESITVYFGCPEGIGCNVRPEDFLSVLGEDGKYELTPDRLEKVPLTAGRDLVEDPISGIG